MWSPRPGPDALRIIQIAALVLASKGAWYAAIAPLCTNTVVMIRTPCGFTPQAICLLEELAMLVKLIVGLARTNIIAQCAQMTNMPLMANVIISALSVPMLMVPLAREKSARLAKSKQKKRPKPKVTKKTKKSKKPW